MSHSDPEGKMLYLWLSVICPEHGLERFKIRIIRKYNIKSDSIILKFRSRPVHGISRVIIGRNVNYTEVKDYIMKYKGNRYGRQNC